MIELQEVEVNEVPNLNLAYGSIEITPKKQIIPVFLPPGQTIQRIPSGYSLIPGRNFNNKATIELFTGQKLWEVWSINTKFLFPDKEASFVQVLKENIPESVPSEYITFVGWVIQPAGSPTVSGKGVENMLEISKPWVSNLSQRGIFDACGGLQPYIPNPTTGIGYIPKMGYKKSGQRVSYYLEDLNEYMDAYTKDRKDLDEEQVKLLNTPVPTGIFNLFKELGDVHLKAKGWVPRMQIIKEAHAHTSAMSTQELQAYGLKAPINEGHYRLLMAVAAQLEWPFEPHHRHNTSINRRRRTR